MFDIYCYRTSAACSYKAALTLNVQAVWVFHMNGWIQNFINDLEHKNKKEISD